MATPDPGNMEHAACALCGSTEATACLYACCPERPEEQFTVVQCTCCGLRFVSPRPVSETMTGYYPEEYYAYQPHEIRPRSHRLKLTLWRRLGLLPAPDLPGDAPILARTVRRVARLALGVRCAWTLPAPHTGARFLDVGCGAGARLMLAADLGWQTFGIDRSEAAIAATRAQGHGTVVADAARLPFAGAAMDYVCLSHVLEHTRDPLATLREAGRVVRPGGLIHVAVPNITSWSAIRFGQHWAANELPRHLQHFSAPTLAAVARAAGLEVLAVRTLADRWVLETTLERAGIRGLRARFLRLTWRAHCRLGRGDNLDAWFTPAGADSAP